MHLPTTFLSMSSDKIKNINCQSHVCAVLWPLHVPIGRPSDLVSLHFLTKILQARFIYVMRVTCLAHLLLDLAAPVRDVEHKLRSSSFSFLQLSVTSSFLCPNNTVSALFSNVLGLCLSLTDVVSQL